MSWWIAVLAGAWGWTLAEYVLHRFDGHGMRGRTRFSREHLAHHADPMYFAPTAYKVAVAVAVAVPLALAGWALFGGPGVAFAASFAATYAAYEVLHRRIHTHPPRGRYGAWARRHHLHHHFNGPHDNHGVTTALWDRVFGTLAPVRTVRVPRRHAPAWMVDANGELRPEFAGTYVLAGRPKGRAHPAA